MSGMLPPEVLVLGASGQVGAGVVAALLEAGSPVLAAGRDRQRLHALAERHAEEPALETLAMPVAGDRDAARLAARIARRPRPLRAVVDAIGVPHAAARLLDSPVAVMRRTLERMLLPRLALARHLLPYLAGRAAPGRYLLIGGPYARQGWAGYGHASVGEAALRMMARVLRDEAGRHGLRVQLLPLDAPLRSDGAERPDGASPRAIAMGTRALAMLGLPRTAGGGTPVSITPGVIEDVPGQAASLPQGEAIVAGREAVLPARDLRDARALLRSLVPTPHVPWNPQP